MTPFHLVPLELEISLGANWVWFNSLLLYLVVDFLEPLMETALLSRPVYITVSFISVFVFSASFIPRQVFVYIYSYMSNLVLLQL